MSGLAQKKSLPCQSLHLGRVNLFLEKTPPLYQMCWSRDARLDVAVIKEKAADWQPFSYVVV